MSFTGEEIAYMQSQPLARLATLCADGQPDGSRSRSSSTRRFWVGPGQLNAASEGVWIAGVCGGHGDDDLAQHPATFDVVGDCLGNVNGAVVEPICLIRVAGGGAGRDLSQRQAAREVVADCLSELDGLVVQLSC